MTSMLPKAKKIQALVQAAEAKNISGIDVDALALERSQKFGEKLVIDIGLHSVRRGVQKDGFLENKVNILLTPHFSIERDSTLGIHTEPPFLACLDAILLLNSDVV
jgi:hypothetical protein